MDFDTVEVEEVSREVRKQQRAATAKPPFLCCGPPARLTLSLAPSSCPAACAEPRGGQRDVRLDAHPGGSGDAQGVMRLLTSAISCLEENNLRKLSCANSYRSIRPHRVLKICSAHRRGSKLAAVVAACGARTTAGCGFQNTPSMSGPARSPRPNLRRASAATTAASSATRAGRCLFSPAEDWAKRGQVRTSLLGATLGQTMSQGGRRSFGALAQGVGPPCPACVSGPRP